MTKRWLKRIGVVAATLLLAGAAWGGWRFGHPSPPPPEQYLTATPSAPGWLSIRFLGTTTLIFSDGKNSVMVDALLTHPGLWTVLKKKIASDPAMVASTLRQARVAHIDLLLATHSHYDHVLDAAAVALKTGATIVGSPSTREVALGGGVPETQIRVIAGGETLTAGAFTVTVFRSEHSPDDHVPGEITRPLHQPALASDYRQGGTYSYLIEHGGTRILVHASANIRPGMYRGIEADMIFLATGGLGRQPDAFAANYWRETVDATGAKLIVPIHWDDFLRPIDQPQLPMRRFMDDFPLAMSRVEPLAKRDGVSIRYMPILAPVDVKSAVAATDSH